MKGKLTIRPKEDLKEGEFLTGYNTEILIGDQVLYGVSAVDISYRPDEMVIGTVRMYTVEEKITGAEPFIMMNHPITNKAHRVKKIEFFGGETVECNEDGN